MSIAISFEGYNSVLKKYYRRGKLPTVKYGFYGDVLTQANVSLEHLKPHSKGGKTSLDNLVLASKSKNNARSSAPLKQFIDEIKANEYLAQFKGIHLPRFDGNRYIKGIRETIERLVK